MNNNQNTTVKISAQTFAALLKNGTTKVEHDLHINFGFPAESVVEYGRRFDGGQTVACLRAFKHGIAETYTHAGCFYFSNGVSSLAEYISAKIVSTGGDYGVGSDELRALKAQGDVMWSDVVVRGGVYRLIQEGQATKMHHLVAVNNGDGTMHPDAEYDANARTLIEGMDLLYMAYERGQNVVIKANNSEWQIDEIMAALAKADPKATVKAGMDKGKEQKQFQNSVNRALHVATHAEDYAKSSVRITENLDAFCTANSVKPEDMLGKVINVYKKSDANKTPMMQTRTVNGVEYRGELIDSIESLMGFADAAAQSALVMFVVK